MGHWVDSIVILGVVLAMIGLTAWARPAMRQPGPGEAHAQ
jgi:hypothetical protein